MKRRELIKSLAMTALGGAWIIPTGQAAAKDAPNKSGDLLPVLSVGASARFDHGLKVTFLKVKNDSRCPMGALCVSAGDAEILLRVRVGEMAPEIVSIHTHNMPRVVVLSAIPPGMVGIPKSYSLKVEKLTPHPKIGKKLRQSDYRLSLSVSVAV